VWFVSSGAVTNAYLALYAKLPPIARHAGSDTGIERAALLQTASDLFDASILGWVVTESTHAAGDTRVTAEASAIQSGIKLMQLQNKNAAIGAIDVLENKSDLSPMERREIGDNVGVLYRFATAALDACNRDTGCYLKILDEPIPPEANANWKAIKAAMMCGLLGDDTTRSGLLARAGLVKNPGVRRTMALAVLHLAPQGDVAGAGLLEAAASATQGGDETFVRVARMLRTRATP
jgi:hypothetical protein